MSYSDYGFVIRCVELADTGRVFYRGRKGAYTREKDAIPPSQTYNFSGAKRAIANLRKMYPDEQYCIKRLSIYYPEPLFDEQKATEKNLAPSIDKALTRLDELWEGKDNGDKMRINEVRRVLMNVKEQLIRKGE